MFRTEFEQPLGGWSTVVVVPPARPVPPRRDAVGSVVHADLGEADHVLGDAELFLGHGELDALMAEHELTEEEVRELRAIGWL